MIELVAFLGNPGREYAQTRHNAGRLLAAQIPFLSAVHWQRKYKGLYTFIEGNRLLHEQTGMEHRTLPSKIHFLIPETYMNLSGNSVYEGASFFKIPPEQILVVHDELELSLGHGSLKFSGGLGGHNGLRSMKACFGTADFWRLRIGIGRPNHTDIASWVLSDFTADEASVLERILDSCAGALIQALIQGPETLLPEWNKKKIVETVV